MTRQREAIVKRVHISYFSATGNTASAVAVMKETLEANGYSVELARVEGGILPPEGDYDAYVFAFSVFGFAPAALFIRYLKRFKRGNKPVYVFSVNGASAVGDAIVNGDSGYAGGYAARILAGKGYSARAIGSASYPVNWTQFFNPVEARIGDAVVAKGDEAARRFAEGIAADRSDTPTDALRGDPRDPSRGMPRDVPRDVPRPARLPLERGKRSLAFMIPLFTSFPRRLLGKLFVADSSCTGCGACAKACPAGAIRLRAGKPAWGSDCQGCNRCINMCPRKAIQTSLARLILHFPLSIAVSILIGISVPGIVLGLIPGLGFPMTVLAGVASVLGAIAVQLFVQLTLGDWVIGFFERVPFLRPLFEYGLTRKSGRYLRAGFAAVPEERR